MNFITNLNVCELCHNIDIFLLCCQILFLTKKQRNMSETFASGCLLQTDQSIPRHAIPWSDNVKWDKMKRISIKSNQGRPHQKLRHSVLQGKFDLFRNSLCCNTIRVFPKHFTEFAEFSDKKYLVKGGNYFFQQKLHFWPQEVVDHVTVCLILENL